MIKHENGCVSCGLPCIGKACQYLDEIVFVCDDCGCEVEDLWEYDGKQLCLDCLLDAVPKVEAE